MNLGGRGGLVRFEERAVRLGDWRLVDDLTALLTAGVTKAEIERGEYRVTSLMHSAEAVRAFEAQWATQRGGGWFALALWLAQRDETAHAAIAQQRKERHGRDTERHGGLGARRARRVSGGGRKPADALGADRDADARRSEDDDDGQRVADAHPARTAVGGRSRQGTLFGERGPGSTGR